MKCNIGTWINTYKQYHPKLAGLFIAVVQTSLSFHFPSLIILEWNFLNQTVLKKKKKWRWIFSILIGYVLNFFPSFTCLTEIHSTLRNTFFFFLEEVNYKLTSYLMWKTFWYIIRSYLDLEVRAVVRFKAEFIITDGMSIILFKILMFHTFIFNKFCFGFDLLWFINIA